MKLPAITLCFARSFLSLSTNATLNGSLYGCSIGGTENCDSTDFYSFKTRTSYSTDILTCYVLNGGKNSSGHLSEIKSARTTGPFSGFELSFHLPNDHFFYYYINDADVEPTSSEIEKFLLPGAYNSLKLEKTVETKLELPFNNCWDRLNLPDSRLVRQLSEANVTYRQVSCFELCFQNFVQNYALEHDISYGELRLKKEVINFDKVKNCNHLCPLECESTQYRISQSRFSLIDFSNEEYSSKWIPLYEKKLNKTINSTEEFNKNYLDISVFFESLKYTKISQTPKTTRSELVSNLGGSAGLFLDLSFSSACRAVKFILGIIFKF